MKHLLLILSFMAIASEARAEDRCYVNDPTGTPMNVRVSPNGRVLGGLYNGTAVRVLDVMFDGRGRPWAYVVPFEGKRGRVLRAYLLCR